MKFNRYNARRYGRRGGKASAAAKREKKNAEILAKFESFDFYESGAILGVTADGGRVVLNEGEK